MRPLCSMTSAARSSIGTEHPTTKRGRVWRRPILEDCGFTEQEIMEILTAIGGHRASGVTAPLGRLLYRADKKSRPCYACPAVSGSVTGRTEKKESFFGVLRYYENDQNRNKRLS